MNLLKANSYVLLMSDYFVIYTETPWDELETEQLSQVRLLSLKSVFKSYPVIEQTFFDDLSSKINDYIHYSKMKTIRRIVGPNNEDYSISNWNFIWAFDDKKRTYQFLFQTVKEEEKTQMILVALAPPELAKLFSKYGKGAIHRTFSILNNPSTIRFLMVLYAKGKSIVEEEKAATFNQRYLENLRRADLLSRMPNIHGDWFPSYQPRCPICNGFMTELDGYKVGFGKLICPKCGYEKIK
ncbi:MAG: hypothetical protein ACFFBW_15680 [Promethearchaeota archaeon]